MAAAREMGRVPKEISKNRGLEKPPLGLRADREIKDALGERSLLVTEQRKAALRALPHHSCESGSSGAARGAFLWGETLFNPFWSPAEGWCESIDVLDKAQEG